MLTIAVMLCFRIYNLTFRIFHYLMQILLHERVIPEERGRVIRMLTEVRFLDGQIIQRVNIMDPEQYLTQTTPTMFLIYSSLVTFTTRYYV